MNTNRFRKTLAVILSLLIATAVFPLTVYAEPEATNVSTWAELKDALKANGGVKLQNDIVAADNSAALIVSKSANVTLDLNGFKIDRGLDSAQKQGNVIIVNGELTVTDSSADGAGKITGGWTDGTGGGVWVRAGGLFTLAGGMIDGNTASNIGGGVYLSGSGGKFIMTGGLITGNTAKNGGGVGMDSTGSVEISGGTISGNTARIHGGGAWIGKNTTLTFSGGTITGNNAQWGGGVYINYGNFDFTGGTISGNSQTHGIDIASRGGTYRPSFDVTVSCGDGGAVTADKSPADMDDTVTLTVEPENYCKLKSLTVTAGSDVIPTEKVSDDTYTFTMPCSPVTVSAEFGELHEVRTGVSLYNDHYGYTDHGCTLTADKEYALEGETVTLTLSTAPGYVYLFGDVNYDIPVTQVSDTTFTFTMPDEDAEAYAYVQKAEYTVLLGGTANSYVSFLLNYETRDNAPFPAEYNDRIDVLFHTSYDQQIGGMTYTYTENGNTVTNEIWYDWNGMDALQGSFMMPNSDVTVRVEYADIYNVTEDWDHVENGLISADVTKAAAGSVVTVAAAPDERYAFSEWNIAPAVELLTDETLANGTRLATFAMPGSDVSFSASFDQVIFDVTAELPDGHGAIAGEDWGRAGENYSFTVTPDEGYTFKTVSALADGEEINCTNNGGVYTFLMPASDVTLRATFSYGSGWNDLAALLREGGEIVLDRDYTASSGDAALEVPEGVSATLDLNGHTVNGNAVAEDDLLTVCGDLRLTDSVGGGGITARDCGDTVYAYSGSFVMTGGALEYTGNGTGCVYVGAHSTFRLDGGTLLTGSGCSAAVYNCGTFEMTGGAISGDACDMVYCNLGEMLFTGGSIRGTLGDEDYYGYGVYLFFADLYLSGDTDIDVTERRFENDPETEIDENDYDIGLSNWSMIHVIGPLSADGPRLGVNGNKGYEGVIADGAAYGEDDPGYTITDGDVSRLKSAKPGYGLRLTDENKIELAALLTVTFEKGDEEAGGEMADAYVVSGGTFMLPACGFEAPAGKEFREWSVRIGEEDPVAKNPDEEITVTDNTTVTAVYAVAADPDQEAADTVIDLINAIGEVTYTDASKAKIDAARTAFNALSEAQQALVTNYAVLEADEARYAELKAAADQAAADQAAADEVIAKIGAIGNVEYTDACKAKIDAARTAYNALTTAQKELVTNYAVLEADEARYAELKAAADQAAADQAAADEVIAKIDAIGEVTYTDASKAKIDAARTAFNALTDAQKALVTNYAVLESAEARYAELKAAADQAAADQAAADEVIAKINAIGAVTYTDASKAKIDAARTAFNALTDAQKALVTNYETLTAAEARYAELKAAAETPTDPTDPTEPETPTEPTDPDTPSEDNKCPWDDVDHGTSFWGRIVRFFHSILYFFAHLFGRR